MWVHMELLENLVRQSRSLPTPPENIPGFLPVGVEMFCFCNKNVQLIEAEYF